MYPTRNSSSAIGSDGNGWPGCRAEIAVFEKITDQPACARGYDNRVRFGQCLQPGGEVRRFADNRLFLRRSEAQRNPRDSAAGSGCFISLGRGSPRDFS